MNPLNKQLKQARKDSAPQRDFKHALWSELDVAFDKEYPRMRFSWQRAFAIPLAAVLLFVTMGAGVYAYSNPEVADGSALYPVKRGLESLEEKFHNNPDAAAKFKSRMLERRIAEGEAMLKKGEISADQLHHIAESLGVTVDEIIEAKRHPELRKELKDEIIRNIDVSNERFFDIIERVGELNGFGNELEKIRVRINDSDLTPEEKRALFPRHFELENSQEER
jgi:hypothetical protein